jgi:hypothetical protein
VSKQPSPDSTDGSVPPAPESVDPQRLLRIAGVVREVLEETRRLQPEPSAVEHLRRVHEQIRGELKEALPKELYEELDELTPEVRDGTLQELALAHAEILGWLEGLFQGTQLAIQLQTAQAARHAFMQQSRAGLPSGPEPSPPDSRYL